MASRRTATLPLSQNQIAQLVDAGYTRVSDLRAAQPARLAQDLGCSLVEALAILKTAAGPRPAHLSNAEGMGAARDEPVGIDADPKGSVSKTAPLPSSGESSRLPSSNSTSNHAGLSKRAGSNALTLLKTARKRAGIVTFSAEIDKQLFSGSGGVPIGQMTEFCGAPGMGKTQLCMQLACNVVIPKSMGGVSGSCVYIDTEGSFMVDRVHEIASALVVHLHKNGKRKRKQKTSTMPASSTTPSFDPSSSSASSSASSASSSSSTPNIPSALDILKNIHCFRVHDHTEQLAVVKTLPAFIRDHPDVKLVILDSVAFHFRHGFHNRYAERARILSQLAQDLNRLADKAGLAVVVTNHVTTRLNRNDGDGGGNNSNSTDRDAYLAPALGESWSHAATNRVELFWNDKTRTARLTKSPSLGLLSVPFQVVSEGVRGMNHRFSKMPANKRTGAPVVPSPATAKKLRVS